MTVMTEGTDYLKLLEMWLKLFCTGFGLCSEGECSYGPRDRDNFRTPHQQLEVYKSQSRTCVRDCSAVLI